MEIPSVDFVEFVHSVLHENYLKRVATSLLLQRAGRPRATPRLDGSGQASRTSPAVPHRLLHSLRFLPLLALVWLGACSDVATPAPKAAQFRTHGDYFQIDRGQGKGWEPFYVNGVNLAIAKPGTFPGELAATRADYDRWLIDIGKMNVNVIRIYTLHYPHFYQALRDYNLAHADKPLYVMHGIWLDEIETGDYITDTTAEFDKEIRYVIDACHGQGEIGLRYGKAFGKYTADISPWVMAFLPGHEMDGSLVLAGDQKWAGYDTYEGKYLRMGKGLPIEGWVARALDSVAVYDKDRYGDSRPVGWSNWPALDPIHHPTESTTFLQDLVDCDLGKFEPVGGFDRGVFVSYHVYPFNPEFIIYDEQYRTTKNATGQLDSYLGYLKDLKAHHKGVPVVVAEFGIPSSMGVAHVNETAWNHGGYDEQAQKDIVVQLYRDIQDSGCAGAVVFEWIDEWFKRTWVTTPTMLPADRGRLWWDVESPEEAFGIVSYYPVPGMSRHVDGQPNDWTAKDFTVATQPAQPLNPVGDGHDAARTLVSAQLAADPAFLFLKLQLDTKQVPDLDDVVLLVGLSTAEGDTGDHRVLDLPLQTSADLGFETLLVLDKAGDQLQILVDDVYNPMHQINAEKKGGGVPTGNANGVYELGKQLVNNNAQYLAQNLPYIPQKQFYTPGKLKIGDSQLDTSSHLQVGPGGTVEVRLPWHALWVTDPSSRSILWDDPATTPDWEAKATAGMRVVVMALKRSAPGKYALVDVLPRKAWTAGAKDATLDAAQVPLYAWPTWDKVESVERKKPLYGALQALFGEPVAIPTLSTGAP